MGEHRNYGRARSLRWTAAAAASAVLLAGCGGGDGDGDDVTLRFVWWGSDTRHELTQEIIDLFEEEHPHITVEPEYGGSFEDHWDRLATQTAGNDAPDVIQMDEQYLREYADRGALLELDGVDTSQFEESAVENGRVDGSLYAITMGLNAQALIANPETFESAGVEMPDDQTWTWDDFAEIVQEVSDVEEDTWGSGGPRGIGPFQLWLRQHGAHVADDDGQLGFGVEDAEEYFAYFDDLMQDGGLPPAELIQEDATAGEEQSLAGTGQEAMATRWTNQMVGLAQSAGTELELLRYPTLTGDAADGEPWFKSSMYLSGYAGTDHPEEVQEFIDFFVNSEEAGMTGLVERGIPPNQEVRDAVAEELDGMDLATVEFIEQLEDDLGEPEPITPAGGSDFQPTLDRYQLEVFFGRMDPGEAAEAMVAEMEGQLE